MVQKAIRGGLTYAVIGGWTGLLVGLGEGASIKDEMLFGATLGGTLGAAFGFLDGLFSIQPARTFHLDAPQGQPKRKIELSPIRIRVRF